MRKHHQRRSVFKSGCQDANHQVIVEYMMQFGPEPIDLSKVGGGVPDLLWGFQGRTILVEIKTPNGFLTPAQERFGREWRGGPVYVVTTEADVLQMVEELTKRREIRTAVRG